ncbi:MAG: hypothetical protein NTW75_16075 [Planctomycetales bacterium]|jgi:hypothetical protein|nr:hypothetical protein [Planctomycetales bacterium]
MVGHKFATGNIRKTKACKLRTAILNSISEEAVQEIVMAVIDLAAKGDLAAAKLIFQTIGRPTGSDLAPSPEITDANFLEIKRELLARIAETN